MTAIVRSGALSELEDSAKDMILHNMRPVTLEAGQHVFRAGDQASNYLVVKEGVIRVSVPTEQGRDILLYRVEAGQTCVLTTAGLLSSQTYDAEAIAETATEAIILPKAAFDELLGQSPRFRQFVFASYGERLHALIALVQEVTLGHVDRRLARHLLRLANEGTVTATHQSLAQELNTAREVVTRLLNMFAERGMVELSRGQVRITDAAALERLSAEV